MISLNTRFKSAVLVIAMLATGHVAAFSASVFVPNSPKKIAGWCFVACWVRLATKGSKFDYKLSDWSADVKEIMEDYNIFDLDLYKRLVDLFDKYVIGRQLSVYPMTIRSKSEDGEKVTAKKDKYVKATPFGVMGLFDAYVIGMLSKVGDIAKDLDSASKLFEKFDSGNVVNITINN
jgi:hypothetical protein